jgi:hypothetical protein
VIVIPLSLLLGKLRNTAIAVAAGRLLAVHAAIVLAHGAINRREDGREANLDVYDKMAELMRIC